MIFKGRCVVVPNDSPHIPYLEKAGLHRHYIPGDDLWLFYRPKDLPLGQRIAAFCEIYIRVIQAAETIRRDNWRAGFAACELMETGTRTIMLTQIPTTHDQGDFQDES